MGGSADLIGWSDGRMRVPPLNKRLVRSMHVLALPHFQVSRSAPHSQLSWHQQLLKTFVTFHFVYLIFAFIVCFLFVRICVPKLEILAFMRNIPFL